MIKPGPVTLVRRWRAAADNTHGSWHDALHECADELEATLQAGYAAEVEAEGSMTLVDSLMAYGEWLEENRVNLWAEPIDDTRTHEDLAHEFVSHWESSPNRATLCGQRRERCVACDSAAVTEWDTDGVAWCSRCYLGEPAAIQVIPRTALVCRVFGHRWVGNVCVRRACRGKVVR